MTRTITKSKSNDILAVVGDGGFIQYATTDEHDRAKKLKGRVVAIKPKRANPRSLGNHRRFFALIRLGFTYWKPEVGLVSGAEQDLAHAVAKRFCTLGGNPDLYELQGFEIAEAVIAELSKRREGVIDLEAYKSEETYRKKVMVEAGLYEQVILPDGGAIKQPWSIAFERMTEDEFREIYSAVHRVIWQKTLFQIFEDQSEMDRAVNQLMAFI